MYCVSSLVANVVAHDYVLGVITTGTTKGKYHGLPLVNTIREYVYHSPPCKKVQAACMKTTGVKSCN